MLNNLPKRFRLFEVKDKIQESATITSFYFAPCDETHWREFEAGQFLTLRIPKGDGDYVHRNYTVSSPPHLRNIYRITVKRECAPEPNLPDGLSSCWLHDTIKPGMEVAIDGPHGAFKLNRHSDKPVILLSGGVGLTPTVSMLHVLAHESNRPVWFIHACDNGHVHALRDEVEQLANERDNVHIHYCYRFGTAQEPNCHSTGFITRQTLQKILPLDDYEVYMCGPVPFMQSLYSILLSLGVKKDNIFYEFFGPATLLNGLNQDQTPNHQPENSTLQPTSPARADQIEDTQNSQAIEIRLNKSGKSLTWDDNSHSLLEFLEANGIEPAFSCRAGICSTCEQSILAGEVEYFEEPLDEMTQGRLLLCCTRPRSSITLDI